MKREGQIGFWSTLLVIFVILACGWLEGHDRDVTGRAHYCASIREKEFPGRDKTYAHYCEEQDDERR